MHTTAYMNEHTHTHTCKYAHIQIHTRIHIYAHIHASIYTQTHIYTIVHTDSILIIDYRTMYTSTDPVG